MRGGVRHGPPRTRKTPAGHDAAQIVVVLVVEQRVVVVVVEVDACELVVLVVFVSVVVIVLVEARAALGGGGLGLALGVLQRGLLLGAEFGDLVLLGLLLVLRVPFGRRGGLRLDLLLARTARLQQGLGREVLAAFGAVGRILLEVVEARAAVRAVAFGAKLFVRHGASGVRAFGIAERVPCVREGDKPHARCHSRAAPRAASGVAGC